MLSTYRLPVLSNNNNNNNRLMNHLLLRRRGWRSLPTPTPTLPGRKLLVTSSCCSGLSTTTTTNKLTLASTTKRQPPFSSFSSSSSSSSLSSSPDYVIVGAGSAGCVLAARLVEANQSVVVLEAGHSDRTTGGYYYRDLFLHMPYVLCMTVYLFTLMV